MKMRRITSLTALLSFVFLVVTGIVLYLVPHGRIAYWSDWRLLGLSKSEWGNIHINLGLLFVLSAGFHIYYNWKMIVSYLKDKTKHLRVFTKEFNVAIVLSLIFVFGTYFLLPPFSWVLDAGEAIKDSATMKYGEPPYGHAELSSLKKFTSKMGLDLPQSSERLKTAEIKFDSAEQTMEEIAKINNMSPRQLYLVMKSPD